MFPLQKVPWYSDSIRCRGNSSDICMILKKKNIVQEYDSTVEIYGVTGNIL